MKNQREGFIHIIILIVIAIIVLKFYFKIDIEEYLSKEDVMGYFTSMWNFVKSIWDDYIWPILNWIWEKAITGAARELLIQAVDAIQIIFKYIRDLLVNFN